MSVYRNRIYPYLVNRFGDPPPIRNIRKRIVPLAQGEVLEIGAGSGANFAYYAPEQVSRLYALDPNPGMIRLAQKQKRRTAVAVEFLGLPGERIPLRDASVDTAVSTLTLCTIPDPAKALAGLRRVLKPQGKLIFFEHGLSPDAEVRRWQNRLEPFHRRLFDGCRLTRQIPSLLARTGFEIEQMDTGYIAEAARPWSYCWWGTAVPAP